MNPEHVIQQLKIPNLIIEQELPRKATIRCAHKFILSDPEGSKYLLELSNSKEQLFYLQRKIEFQKKFEDAFSQFSFTKIQSFDFKFHTPYVCYEFLSLKNNNSQVNEFFTRQSELSKIINLSEENINSIVKELLNSYPSKYHNSIIRNGYLNKLINTLNRYKDIGVSIEHGDFTPNNIFSHKDNLHINDFEFSRNIQPLGFDKYDYCQSKGFWYLLWYNFFGRINNYEFNNEKYKAINKINKDIDNQSIFIKEFNTLEDKELKSLWSKLDLEDYHLSYEWCKLYCEAFNLKNLKIITVFDEKDDLALLIPFFIKKSTLHLIGSDPELFDGSSIYYKDRRLVNTVLSQLLKKGLSIKFKNLAEKPLSNIFSTFLVENNVGYSLKIRDVAPIIETESAYHIPKRVIQDINRITRKFKLSDDLNFTFNSEKTQDLFEFFKSFHSSRWNKSSFTQRCEIEKFTEKIFFSKLSVISVLRIKDEIISIHLGYLSGQTFTSSIPSYDNSKSRFSPGKLLLYNLVNECISRGLNIDFGRGNENYKYWFTKSHNSIFDLTIYHKKRSIKAIFEMLKNLF